MRVMVLYSVAASNARNAVINICLDYGLEKVQRNVYLGDLDGRLKHQFFAELQEFVQEERGRRVRVFEFRRNAERKIA